MSRTQHEADLCIALVDDVYGELSSRIFTVLVRRGRLTLQQLSQHSGIRPVLLKQGLVILIQQNLLYYNHDSLLDITFYEANWDAAFALARTGRILDVVEGRLGEDAKDVVQNLLLLGNTRIGDLVDAYAQKKAQAEKATAVVNGTVNGKTEEHVNGTGEVELTNGDNQATRKAGLAHVQLDSILYLLLQCGYIQPVSAGLFKSPADAYADLEREVMKEHFEGGIKGPKKQIEFQTLVRTRLTDMRHKARDWQPLVTGNKRLRDEIGPAGPDKRRKLSNGAALNGTSHGLGDTVRLDRNMIVRVNHEKFAVVLRNQNLVELAEHYVGVTTAYVYSQVLSLMEGKIQSCRQDPLVNDPDSKPEPITVTLNDIVASIPKSLDMTEGIAKPPKVEKVKREGDDSDDDIEMKNVDMTVNGDRESDSDEDVFRPPTPIKAANKVSFAEDRAGPTVDKSTLTHQVKQHLLLLSKDKRRFIRDVRGAWTVDFEELGKFLREQEVDTVVHAKFQEKGVRLVRLLREQGKLEEKPICKSALIKMGDVRTMLVEMQVAGYLDVQEIPRDATRVPTKTYFLWYHDSERVAKVVTDSIYKAMHRALQRLHVERFREKDKIDFALRSDIAGDLSKMTTETTKKLKEFYRKEEFLSALMAKLDKTAAVFREY